MSQSRQLAAIMFTDIVGYTALMENDEQKDFSFLKKTALYISPS
jgi:class 3 adenylate cyclase